MTELCLAVNSKGGRHFRKYTKDTLQMLFDTSPSAGCFEIIIVIEGMVFMGVRSIYLNNNDAAGYDIFLKDKIQGKTFFNAIDKLYIRGIVDEPLRKKLHIFRNMRNDIAHDLFQLKTIFTSKYPVFKDYPYDKSLKDLFDLGLDVFCLLIEDITPGIPTQKEYEKRFKGFYRRNL